MKKCPNLLFFVFILTVMFVIPNISANAAETSEEYMQIKDEATVFKMTDQMNAKNSDEQMMVKDELTVSMMKEHMASPRKQMKMGVESHLIQCNAGHELVFKSHNWAPSCVKSSSVERLIAIGWASNHMPEHEMMKNNMDNNK